MGVWQEGWLNFWKQLRARLLGFSNEKAVEEIRSLLRDLLQRERAAAPDLHELQADDRRLYEQIKASTEVHNRNNITRTAAYFEVYLRSPNLHWALLAHMVSRNGGYSMTDLRGDLIGRVMDKGEAEHFFQFLERANWLIFGDAYPQLLLYEASVATGKPLFHLLPYFGVSRFMSLLWERFWETGDQELLTLALIVNEQNYIEHRVVQHPGYKPVIESFEFQAQTYLNLTQVAIPYRSTANSIELAGCVVDTFLSLTERIDTGRRLYAILFGRPEVLDGVIKFATTTPHSGSRADYCPDLYTARKPIRSSKRYYPRVDGLRLRPGAKPIYSPRLEDCWPDVTTPEAAGNTDWCCSADVAEQLFSSKPSADFNITKRYGKTLMLVEKAVAAESWINAKK
ncbi:hypothetical protein CIG75_01570 [Tumebacillus algifaecis]|uniref:DUF2515 domain-containing protein n=1 Tax=Tumebacillus algifaecis TaxID=1214604 RepID=A0A223CWS3_9BACL|nr:DUF2515 family protein [Tumebacillus algifaecis]ASS73788.1 hypothetical protein CIG75_01570 [Tumebacillus algifaecis]